MEDYTNLEKGVILEWHKGEKVGQQEVVSEITQDGNGRNVVNFKDGGRIFKDILNSYMTFIGISKGIDINVQDISEPEQKPNVTQKEVPVYYEQNQSFCIDVLQKANKDVNLSMSIKLEIPFVSDKNIKTLLELYGEDLRKALTEFVRQQITEELLTNNIEKYINNKYKIK